MRRNEWIHTLGTILICASFLITASSNLAAKERAGIRPTFNYGEDNWKHVPSGVKSAGRGKSSVRLSNPFSGRTLPRVKMPKLPKMPKVPGFGGDTKILGPKVVMKKDNLRYLHRTGPVNMKFDGYVGQDFDRNDIIYVEHEGQFPKAPELPSPEPTPKAPAPPPAPVPAPTQGVGETAAPVQVTTVEPTLPQLLNSAPNIPVMPSPGSINFHKKIDGVSPNTQEIYTPFIVPYNATPPAVSIKGKATYIRE